MFLSTMAVTYNSFKSFMAVLYDQSLIFESKSNIISINLNHTAQKMKFSIKDFFSNCDQIRHIY